MIIETNITVDSVNNINISQLVADLEMVLRQANGQPTDTNITNMDDPISKNPINYRIK